MGEKDCNGTVEGKMDMEEAIERLQTVIRTHKSLDPPNPDIRWGPFIADLEHFLSEVDRLKVECRLRQTAVDRWVPCPDHRDKVVDGCYVCKLEITEKRVKELEEDKKGMIKLTPEIMKKLGMSFT